MECHNSDPVTDKKSKATLTDCYDLETFLRNDHRAQQSSLPPCCVPYTSKTMDNAGFEQDNTRSTEMRDVAITVDKIRLNGDGTELNGDPASTSSGTPCRPEACLAARKKYLAQGPQSADQSPWHKRKTIYLLTVIVLLIVWIIVYSTLHMHGLL